MFSSWRRFWPTSWACVTHLTRRFLLIFRQSASRKVFLEFPTIFTSCDFVGFSFLVSGNLRNTSRVKSLEEINYFDGDASAVTADLSNNVDVNLTNDFENISFSKTISDLLPRSEWVAFNFETNRQRRPRAEKLHFPYSRADGNQVTGEHEAFVRVSAQMQIWRRIRSRLLSANLHSGPVPVGLSNEKVSGSLQLFAVFLQAKRCAALGVLLALLMSFTSFDRFRRQTM